MSADSEKELLGRSNHQRYREFSLNSDLSISLTPQSSVPWVGASKQRDIYKKTQSNSTNRHIKFITKNDQPHAFLWQSTPEQLKKGVRWGIVKTHSITGKVIATLGTYRVTAHERAAKGMVSNSQAVKLKLLDLFQDRFEALESVESMVSKDNNSDDYKKILGQYIEKLGKIEKSLNEYFAEVDLSGLNETSINQIRSDIQSDIVRARSFLNVVENETNLRSYNRSRGHNSILEFVKQQMMHGLYELQGINQDISYSSTRYFALTRGELNDYIEDARKEIDDHQADARNAVTEKHHGLYSKNNEELISYDFSNDELTPARERQVLLAISFIEGWDTLENKKDTLPVISNGTSTEELDTYAATKWKTHRNSLTLVKSIGFFILNFFKSMFVSTHVWEEEAWKNKDFHLVAVELRSHITPNDPLWKKPFTFLKQIGYVFIDLFKGIRDFGADLVIKMPTAIVDDWESTKSNSSLEGTLKEAAKHIADIKAIEKERLTEILKKSGYESGEASFPAVSKINSRLASVEYALTGGEQNDILTSVARGLNGFSSVFTHNIYAKDPLGGLFFTATYAAGAGIIYMPAFSESLFGSSFVNWFTDVSYTMASSPMGAAIAGGSSLAEASALVWDGVVHGPSGIALDTFYQFGEDPLTIGAYCVAAYALGYFLANGIAGHQIPWLSKMLQEDLGTDPSTGYPIIGAKFAVMLYEAFLIHSQEDNPQPELSVTGNELDKHPARLHQHNIRIIERFNLASWLSANAAILPKLDSKQQFAISRQIEELFNKEESKSLKKLLYPETHPLIAFQIVYIPLSYIPAVLRLVVAIFLSMAAWAKENPHPWEPIRRAGEHLVDMAKRDLSRLIVFVTYAVYLPYSLLTSLLKMIANITTMAIGRVAGLFDSKPAHFIYKGFAHLHNLMRSIGEFFYPARTIKSVEVAHPTDTIVKAESSYVKLLTQIGDQTKARNDFVEPKDDTNHDASFTLLTANTSRKEGTVVDRDNPANDQQLS